MKLIRIFTILILAGFIASCAQGAAYVPTPTQDLETITVLPSAGEALQTLALPTATGTATATLTLTPTNTSTPTLTLVPSQTASPTPSALFDQAQVTTLSEAGGVYSMVVKVPGLKQAFNLVIDERKFNCVINEQYPNLLFCTSKSSPHVNQTIALVFTDPTSGQAIYSGSTIISPAVVPTETPVGYFSCADRGKNVFCEVECRVYGGSTPCVVATCNDACGVYFSVHTCPEKGKNTGMCSPDVDRQMRQRYGIPLAK